MFSEFQNLFDDARSMLLDLHAVDVFFCQDTTVGNPVWRKMRATIERNMSSADPNRPNAGPQLSRQACHFLFEKAEFRDDDNGQKIMPGVNSVVRFDGWMWRASQVDRMGIWQPEDHEGQVIRFRTTQQERDQ